MARSWTRLHEHLGRPMGPLTHGMIMDAVASKLGETDDLDWKKQLPTFVPKPGIWNEFAKDVTAMANTRGGLLVYGVTDDIEAVGIDLAEVNEQQLTQTLRNGVQPYLSGVDIIPLPAPGGGGPDFLIVDVTPSELAPHFQYGWEQKDKDRATFNAPYRVGSETFYMSEHQVARAYQERFSRQARAETALAELVQQAASVVLGESVPGCAWLVVAGRPSRPVPRLVPAPSRAEAKAVLLDGVKTAARLRAHSDPYGVRGALSDRLSNGMHVGLRRWVDSNILVPELRGTQAGAMVELHHDGGVVVCVDLSHPMPSQIGAALVDTWTLPTALGEAVAVIDAHRRRRLLDSTVDITAAIVADGNNGPDFRFLACGYDIGQPRAIERARQPLRVIPATTELPPIADDDVLQATGKELVEGLLHQFGINAH
ncbi:MULTISPECIES: AlbA family DNA-binding domain-containing protein [unclassified Streptomyces]|uniref:AlbA family DNA-binding domain-containing protein n=1 Tax=unclassified Streptomyces TaxID=2593676 RepID=UPI002E28A5AC|nr:ATP-binding protein [Streptomyces sp. NBC_01439]